MPKQAQHLQTILYPARSNGRGADERKQMTSVQLLPFFVRKECYDHMYFLRFTDEVTTSSKIQAA